MLIVSAGIAVPFWLDAFSNLATIGALTWWRPPVRRTRRLPAERLAAAIRIGLRYARHNRPLRATLVRAVAFFLFASAYWALLPLFARSQIAGGAEVYGVLLAAIGAGAVGGAFALPRLKAKLGADGLAVAGTVGTAIALVLYAIAHAVAVRSSRASSPAHAGSRQSRIQDFRAARAARLGPGARSGDLRHRVLRCAHVRQRDVGRGGKFSGLPPRS